MVENSWGATSGHQGHLIMTDEWFDAYTFRIVVDKKYLTDKVRAVMNDKPTMLPPLGSYVPCRRVILRTECEAIECCYLSLWGERWQHFSFAPRGIPFLPRKGQKTSQNRLTILPDF